MTDADWGWKVAQVASGLVLGLLAWLGNRMTNRLDALEKNSVTRDELKESFNQMREERKAMHQDNRDALKRIETKLDEAQHIGVMATRVERAEQDIGDLRDWKHQVDPYIPRRVDP